MLTADPDLHGRAGKRRINPIAVWNGHDTFVLPQCGTPITLACRAIRPSEARPWIVDDLFPGAIVRRLVCRSGAEMRDAAMNDLVLTQGWWQVESDTGWPCRWTTGDAMLPFPSADLLEVELSAVMLYPAAHIAVTGCARPARAATYGDLPGATASPKSHDAPQLYRPSTVARRSAGTDNLKLRV